MPLNGFTSLCSKNAKQIVSRDKGNPQYHKANNVSNSEVTHYQIDGKVIKTGDRCDYLLTVSYTHLTLPTTSRV